MRTLARTDPSIVGRWWWTVDRWTLGALGLLLGFGVVLAMAASPAVAERLGADSLHFVRRHLTLIPLAAALVLGVSLLTPVAVRRLALLGFLGSLVLLVATLVFGPEIKGAQRWLPLLGFSLQPSEFVKPTFAVVAAWLFASARLSAGFPGRTLAAGAFVLVVGLLLLQPDVGQAAVISSVWLGQFFLAGLPWWVVIGAGVAGVGGLIGAYFALPHVTSRIDRFLDPTAGDNYQISRSLEAFTGGGLFGRGPGEGTVKNVLPDAHSDFVFAVAGEEQGLVACLVIVLLFGFVVLRGFARALQEENLFVLLACAGLLMQFGLQALVNMASTLHLMPTKGMTLPLISYGGSSLLATSLGLGMVLALTRRRPGAGGAA